MRKSLFILFLILVASFSTAFTSSFEVVERTAKTGDPAEFYLNVENTISESQSFTISSVQSPPPTGSWFYYTESKDLGPGENDTFVITVTPTSEAIQHNYKFEIVLRSSNGEKQSFQDYFAVRSDHDLQMTDLELKNDSVRPGEEVNASLSFVNTDPKSVDYRVSAALMNRSAEKAGTVPSGNEVTHSFGFRIPSGAPPGEKALNFELEGSEGVQTFNQTLEVSKFKEVETTVSVDDRFLERSKVLKAENSGNYPVEVRLNETVPNYLEPLKVFHTPPDEEEKVSGATTYYWVSELEPGEEVSVRYETLYWPPVVITVALLTGAVLLVRLRSGIEFSKKVVQSGEDLKIHLEIENGSGKVLKDIEVVDFIPDIASVGKEFPMAEPVVRKTGNGTRLTWKIGKMDPGEHRIFVYSIKPEIELEDSIVLDSAKMEKEDVEVAETDKVEAEFRTN